MDGFDLDMWASSSIVDGGSAPGLGGPSQGTSLTRVTSEGTSGGGLLLMLVRDCLLIPLPIKLNVGWYDCRDLRLTRASCVGEI